MYYIIEKNYSKNTKKIVKEINTKLDFIKIIASYKSEYIPHMFNGTLHDLETDFKYESGYYLVISNNNILYFVEKIVDLGYFNFMSKVILKKITKFELIDNVKKTFSIKTKEKEIWEMEYTYLDKQSNIILLGKYDNFIMNKEDAEFITKDMSVAQILDVLNSPSTHNIIFTFSCDELLSGNPDIILRYNKRKIMPIANVSLLNTILSNNVDYLFISNNTNILDIYPYIENKFKSFPSFYKLYRKYVNSHCLMCINYKSKNIYHNIYYYEYIYDHVLPLFNLNDTTEDGGNTIALVGSDREMTFYMYDLCKRLVKKNSAEYFYMDNKITIVENIYKLLSAQKKNSDIPKIVVLEQNVIKEFQITPSKIFRDLCIHGRHHNIFLILKIGNKLEDGTGIILSPDLRSNLDYLFVSPNKTHRDNHLSYYLDNDNSIYDVIINDKTVLIKNYHLKTNYFYIHNV